MATVKCVIFLIVVTISFVNQAKAAPPQSEAAAHIRQALENGGWLCDSPQSANDFWSKLGVAQNAGVEIKVSDMDSIAKKSGCGYVKSDHLKLMEVDGSTALKVSGDANDNPKAIYTGWVRPQEYVAYMRTHVVRKPN
jgi:hypothetical protein